ncbi:substrate-binding domain-containing protein [Bacillus massiliigorillae]|uniref:substrate-binding domain-containing protein n=1 Tax=Bacillus massiliigorillae TaxID=1243664 RepID=UPI0003A8715F|nr:substrate-binding domain-containing protein [Bacillus massiliigorillae]
MKIRNKSLFFYLMIMVLSAALLVAGCSNTKDDKSKEDNKQTAEKASGDLILATTTSTQDSGLLDELIPMFEEQTDVRVKTIAVGSGRALEMAKSGEADALLVHAPADEEKLVESKDVTNRKLVMHNDFIIVGPKEDPAGIKGLPVQEALKKIYESKNIFVSRGDDSGTHKKELALWKEINIEPSGQYYQETGSGMGDTLKVAFEKGGYTLADRGTYLALKNDVKLEILVQGDDSLLNIYHAMQVNPEKSDKINSAAAKAFVEFMVNKDTQKTIKEFGVDKYGEPLFFPDAK